MQQGAIQEVVNRRIRLGLDDIRLAGDLLWQFQGILRDTFDAIKADGRLELIAVDRVYSSLVLMFKAQIFLLDERQSALLSGDLEDGAKKPADLSIDTPSIKRIIPNKKQRMQFIEDLNREKDRFMPEFLSMFRERHRADGKGGLIFASFLGEHGYRSTYKKLWWIVIDGICQDCEKSMTQGTGYYLNYPAIFHQKKQKKVPPSVFSPDPSRGAHYNKSEVSRYFGFFKRISTSAFFPEIKGNEEDADVPIYRTEEINSLLEKINNLLGRIKKPLSQQYIIQSLSISQMVRDFYTASRFHIDSQSSKEEIKKATPKRLDLFWQEFQEAMQELEIVLELLSFCLELPTSYKHLDGLQKLDVVQDVFFLLGHNQFSFFSHEIYHYTARFFELAPSGELSSDSKGGKEREILLRSYLERKIDTVTYLRKIYATLDDDFDLTVKEKGRSRQAIERLLEPIDGYVFPPWLSVQRDSFTAWGGHASPLYGQDPAKLDIVRIPNPPYPFLSLDVVEAFLPLARELDVSGVARGDIASSSGDRGFLSAYRQAGGDWRMLDRVSEEEGFDADYWERKRHGFIRRHLEQIEQNNRPLWITRKGKEIPSRQHLALIMWAYSPEPRRVKAWAARQ